MTTQKQDKKPETSDLTQETQTPEPRQLSAADFRPFFPESSGNCVLLWGANSLTITEDKGFKPTLTIPYSQEWLDFVSQKVTVTISDSFKKVDNEEETITVKKTAAVTGGYLLTCSLNGALERSSTNFYAKQTGKDDTGKTKYGNKTETGLERVAAAMSACDLSPATFGQEKKQAFVFAKFVAWVDAETKPDGKLAAYGEAWANFKKKYPTSRLLERGIDSQVLKNGPRMWLYDDLIAAGYTPPIVPDDSDDDMLVKKV